MNYLIYQLKNEQAAAHLLDEMKNIYDRLVERLLQFPVSRDTYSARKGYHEAVIGQMNYTMVSGIKADVVNIVGIFHQLENRWKKLEIVDALKSVQMLKEFNPRVNCREIEYPAECND